ncbi:hypothetical protein M434DRAFT_22390 [Hypoxylon sp. CO27-5]|nr:hypothetical protein M434DRAFT_22390 [Hypoxylon sp. CO27-5]
MITNPESQSPTQLISHFTNRDRDNQLLGWVELPSPALIDWIESRPEILPSHPGRRLRALVPGCGKGYDVVMLALHGFDATELRESSAHNFASESSRARRMSELLSPNGVLACLEFPLYKELTAPGPPWGLKGVHWNILAEGGDGIIKEESDSETGQLYGRFERVAYFKPRRSYENGKGTNMFSVWKLKK